MKLVKLKEGSDSFLSRGRDRLIGEHGYLFLLTGNRHRDLYWATSLATGRLCLFHEAEYEEASDEAG